MITRCLLMYMRTHCFGALRLLPRKGREEQEVDITAKHEDLITIMPDLIQDKIFGLLSVREKVQAAQLCSSWRQIVYRPCQWMDVRVGLKSNKLSNENLSSWKERKIRHAVVDDLQSLSKKVDVLHDWSGLASLEMSTYTLPFHVLQKMFCQNFLLLKELGVSVRCGISPVFVSFHEVFQHLPNLEDLRASTDDLSDIEEAINTYLKGMKHLSLRFRKDDSHPKFCLEFLNQMGNLQSLTLEGMTLSGMACLKSSFKALKALFLQFCNLGTDRWPEILSQMSFLEELGVSLCKPEVENAFRSLGQGLGNLKVFKCTSDLGGPLDAAAAAAAEEEEEKEEEEELRPFGQMSALQELGLTCYDISGSCMQAVSSSLKKLRSLIIVFAYTFSAEGMKYIAQVSPLQELTLIFSRVDGSGLKILSEGSCQLRKLELSGCEKIKAEDVKHVAGMSSLRELTLHCLDLGPTGMSHLTQGDLRLQTLVVENCGQTAKDLCLCWRNSSPFRSFKLRVVW